MSSLNSDQSDLQFGFTKNTSPAMASLLISEASLDAKISKSPLHIATLDSQKAFDVVSHPILLDKLYHSGVNLRVWSLVKGMYEGLSSKVKWEGGFSPSFKIRQGVRQGGILSTHLYKLYINDLLVDLESTKLGKHIGCQYTGCPTCADDLSLVPECSYEFQEMLTIAHQYSCTHRYVIHPDKSVAITKFGGNANAREPNSWLLGDKLISVQDRTTHLGLTRSSKNENKLNIEEKISIARRTLYSLLNVGIHRRNGLNPRVSYRIYQAYVLPRLLSGLETLPLNQTQLRELTLFHNKTLRDFQSLPQRTATSAVLLFLGALPLEAEIHRRQLSLYFGILYSKNHTLLGILHRQIAISDSHSESFFVKVIHLLHTYQLPLLHENPENLPTKLQWKRNVSKSVEKFWTEKLHGDLVQKSTLKFCNIGNLEIGKTHSVWNSTLSEVSDVKKSVIKARMLAGVYILQKQKFRFDNVESSLCPLCYTEEEDIVHFLARCPVFHEIRKQYVDDMYEVVNEHFGQNFWSRNIKQREDLVKFILDASFFVEQKNRVGRNVCVKLETITRDMCYRIHSRRLNILKC